MARMTILVVLLLAPAVAAQTPDWTVEVEIDPVPMPMPAFTAHDVIGLVRVTCPSDAFAALEPPTVELDIQHPPAWSTTDVAPITFERGLCQGGMEAPFTFTMQHIERIGALDPQLFRVEASSSSAGPQQATANSIADEFIAQVGLEGQVIIEPVATRQKATSDPRFRFYIENDSNADLRLLPTVIEAPFKAGEPRPIMLPQGASGEYELEFPVTGAWDAGPLIVEWQAVHMFGSEALPDTVTTEVNAIHSRSAGSDGEMQAPGPLALLPLLGAIALRGRP